MNAPAVRHLLLTFGFSLCIALAGCGGGGTESSDTSQGTSPPSQTAANPTLVSATLDSSARVSRFIQDPAQATTITATATDGTVFSLFIPAGALLTPETVTLTPVTVVAGLPLSGGLTAAVDLQPNGLRLDQPALLTVTPAAGVNLDSLVAFGYQQNELYLYPVATMDGTSFTLQLMHFSGYGSGSGTASDVTTQQEHATNSAENNYQQQLSDIMTDVARRVAKDGVGSPTAEELDAMIPIYREWYSAQIKPRLVAAQTNEADLRAAIREFLTWLAGLKTVDLESAFSTQVAEGFGLIAVGIRNAIDKAYLTCKEQNDTNQVPNMLGWEVDAQRLGLWDNADPTVEKVRNCATFKLDFSSRIDFDTGILRTSSDVNALVPITLAAGLLDFNGADTLNYPSFTAAYTDNLCQVLATGTTPGTLDVPEVMLDLNLKDSATHDVFMILTPSDLQESMEVQCPDGYGGTITYPATSDNWYTGFYLRRTDEGIVDPNFGLILRDWTVTGGATYATKDLSGVWSTGGLTVSESTTLKLLHTPR